VTGPIAHGAVTPGAGAAAGAGGTYRFPLAEGTYASADVLSARFGGEIRFSGHEGALDVSFAEPRVEIDGDTGSLVVDAVDGGTEHHGVTLATLDLGGVTAVRDGDEVVLAGIPATLTASGAGVFAGFYTAGEALDPLTLRLAVDDAGALPAAASTSTSTVGSPGPSPVGGAAGSLPRTGAVALDLLRWALVALGLGLVATGGAQVRRASR
jgi:hypothetical protein